VASLYLKNGYYYLSWGRGLERKQRATGLRKDQEAKARQEKADLEQELRGAKSLGFADQRTVRWYKKLWVAERLKNGHRGDESWLRHSRSLDSLRMDEVRPSHIAGIVQALKNKDELAPRSVRHVYATLHRMFEDAVAEEVIPSNPAKVKRGVLPKKADKDPTWRPTAIFERWEVELLLSSPVVPLERRTLYALLFLTGCRIGEVAALTWDRYQPEARPLGRLLVAHSFNRKQLRVKGVKTEVPRQVPVHPVLADYLRVWRETGWCEYRGRLKPPGPEDLILPSYRGAHLRDPVVYANLQRDLARLKLRARRTHDARRSFVSMCQEDGASREILRSITHGPPADIMGLYTTYQWSTLCREVARLNINPANSTTSALLDTSSPQKDE
jgi:integrase